MVDDLANCIEATDAGAWVDTLGVDASFVSWTVGADGTFWATAAGGSRSEEAWQTFADGVLAGYTAHGVNTARGRVARVGNWRF